MRTLLLYTFLIGSCAILSCTHSNNPVVENKATQGTMESEKHKDELFDNEPLPNKRFGKSEIIKSKFDPNLIFGVWALSYDDPACNFEINKKRILLCDYDGDGERLYRIVYDSIFLDNPSLIFKGKILKSTQDTLVIHWQQNEKSETLLRWKN